MQIPEDALTNHAVTICLQGGATLGPFNATWSKDKGGDVRELSREYDRFLQSGEQKRFKFHLHDTYSNSVHTLIVDFRQITGIYDHIQLSS